MELKPERLVAQLGAEAPRAAYLVAGAEPLLVLEAADAIRARARECGYAEREVFDADGREFDWNALDASFRAPSLFSAQRLIELRLPTGRPGKEGAEVIAGYCAEAQRAAKDGAGAPEIVLLVTAREWSRQHGGKWSEAIAGVGHVVLANPVRPHELEGWLESRMRQRGVRAERAAVQRLAERVQGNLLAAAQEVDKLALLAGEGTLDAARMESLVADAARFDVFRLVDAALAGQAAQAARMLAGLRAEGEAVPALMGMVVMELNRVAALARVQARGGNLAAEFKAQRVWDSKQAVYKRALSRHPAARWERFVVMAGAVDRIAKGRVRSGEEPADAWLALERLLVAVAEPKAAALAG
ncbi:DNA polymerase III subunit delta [Luteimonas composti]|uniref:DNA polymerase III subunit delta n=1 Tax=Luteimonas composti TaxID=398257 RepID=A0ABT6MRR4_9GAMM|nr:DNA polymerase III subunit delta [Luteimonas composti]MDH7453300.1 DNA polymerase III subunit delta [Luteimonas composti]